MKNRESSCGKEGAGDEEQNEGGEVVVWRWAGDSCEGVEGVGGPAGVEKRLNRKKKNLHWCGRDREELHEEPEERELFGG